MTSKERNIRRLVKNLSGVEEHKIMLKKMFFVTFPHNNVSKKIYDEILDKMDTSELYNKYVTIYSDVFTGKEIKELLDFYESPIGKKATAHASEIAMRSIEAGKSWLGNYIVKEEDNIKAKIDKILLNEAMTAKDDKINPLPDPALQTQKVTEARYNFAQDYAKGRGWSIENLSLEQVMEIRSQDGWKEPKIK
jgi:hypothetical protein